MNLDCSLTHVLQVPNTQPIYSRCSDSLSVLCRWFVEIELVLTRLLTWQRINGDIAFTDIENPDSWPTSSNKNKFKNTINSKGRDNSLAREPAKSENINFDLISYVTFWIISLKVRHYQHSFTSLANLVIIETCNFLPIFRKFWIIRPGKWCFNFSRKLGICVEYGILSNFINSLYFVTRFLMSRENFEESYIILDICLHA